MFRIFRSFNSIFAFLKVGELNKDDKWLPTFIPPKLLLNVKNFIKLGYRLILFKRFI